MLEESVYRRKSNENPTLLFVGSWIIIVPRKHDNLYRKNRFLVLRASVNCNCVFDDVSSTVLRGVRSTTMLSCRANFIIRDALDIVNDNVNDPTTELHYPRVLLNPLERISVTFEKKSSFASHAITLFSVFRKRIRNSPT